jgi:ABC-2 type transport system ATP-binding protein
MADSSTEEFPPRARAVFAVETVSLSKRFGRKLAVDDVSLQIPRASVYALLGENGAGKSTTIRLLRGLLKPTEGAVRLFDKDVSRERKAAVAGTSALMERLSFYPQLSGRENLHLARRVLGVRKSEVERVLAFCGMEAAATARVGSYSLGMRQRLALARALMGSPRLIILDEPTNGLDPPGIAQVRELICALPAQGVTVLLSTHLLSEVEQTADYVGLMHKGRLVYQGALEALIARGRQTVVFKVGEPGRALEVLAAAGFAARSDGAGVAVTLPKEACADADVAAVNVLLVRAAVQVFGIGSEGVALDQAYHRFVGEHADGERA